MLSVGINRWESVLLFVGDVVVLYVSLWATLSLRALEFPTASVWQTYTVPFSILIIVWLFVFFIAGLYEKHTSILKKRLPSVILNTQIANSLIAILFFYLVPYFGITPKTILFIYLLVSFGLILAWRRFGIRLFDIREQQSAVLIGSGEEMQELKREVNENPRYGLHFASSIDVDNVGALDFQKEIVERIYSENINTIVIDTNNNNVASILHNLYNLMFSGVRFIDMHKVYEDIFDRVPLSLVEYSWFLENISVTRKFTYEFLKRFMDIVITLPLLSLSLILFPFVWLMIKLDDKGPLFLVQERIGRNNKPIHIIKVRTMTGADVGEEALHSKQEVTKVGRFLRKSRIDELPQLWNVLRGDLSLIGPRPEIPAMVKHYESEVPFYNVRHLIKPGISGWAQIYHENHPHHGADVKETKVKLSYDLFYIKNRSLFLDLKIALKTLKTLVLRAGI